MDRNRLRMMGALLAALVVVVGGFFLGVQPQLASARDAQTSAATVSTENQQLATSLETLKHQYSKLDSLTAQLGKLKASVPEDVNSGAFITELNTVATSSGVSLTNIAFGTAAAYVAPVVTTPAASSTATASPSASASATATATAVPTASTPVAPAVATDPLITAANFTDIPVTVTVEGTYAQAVSFLEGLRGGNRLFLVNTLSSAATSSSTTGGATPAGSISTWSIGGLIYALTDAASAQQSQITGTSTAADSTTGSSSSTDTAAGK